MTRILPPALILEVEQYIDSELNDASQYDNRKPFDISGVDGLHQLAAAIYVAGWEAGERAEATRDRYQRSRERDERDRRAAAFTAAITTTDREATT